MAVVQTLIGNVKGPQGDTGATGQQGPQGDAATIEVGSVSTTAYGNSAQVVNVGTEQEAVLNFVIPQGKPGERTTTMGGLTLDTITTSTESYPVPAVNDTGATAFGKIVKWFGDALAAITGKLDKANVANNLTTTAEGYALDARQGKTLNDSLETLGNTQIIGSASSTSNNNVSYDGEVIRNGTSGRYMIFATLYDGTGYIFSICNDNGSISKLAGADKMLCFYSTATTALCIKTTTATSFGYKVVKVG